MRSEGKTPLRVAGDSPLACLLEESQVTGQREQGNCLEGPCHLGGPVTHLWE